MCLCRKSINCFFSDSHAKVLLDVLSISILNPPTQFCVPRPSSYLSLGRLQHGLHFLTKSRTYSLVNAWVFMATRGPVFEIRPGSSDPAPWVAGRTSLFRKQSCGPEYHPALVLCRLQQAQPYPRSALLRSIKGRPCSLHVQDQKSLLSVSKSVVRLNIENFTS